MSAQRPEMEASMPKNAEQSSGHWLEFGLPPIWLGLGGIAVLIWALILGVVPLDLPISLTSTVRPQEPETTGFAASMAAAREPEIDILTGTPLTRLGPADLVAGSDALKHAAPMTKARLNSQARIADARRPVRRDAPAARAGQPKQYARSGHRNQMATVTAEGYKRP
jgi:hypothetical protein